MCQPMFSSGSDVYFFDIRNIFHGTKNEVNWNMDKRKQKKFKGYFKHVDA